MDNRPISREGVVIAVLFLLGMAALGIAAANKHDLGPFAPDPTATPTDGRALVPTAMVDPEPAFVQAFEDATGGKLDITNISLSDDVVILTVIDMQPSIQIDASRHLAATEKLAAILASVDEAAGPHSWFALFFIAQLPDGQWVGHWMNTCTYPPELSCVSEALDNVPLAPGINHLRWKD